MLRLIKSVWMLSLVLLSIGVVEAGEFTYRGKVEQGGLLFASVPPGSRASIDGKEVRVSPNGDFLIGFNRDHPDTSTVVITYPNKLQEQHVFNVAKRKYDIQKIEGVAKKYVSPPESTLKRIRADNRLIGIARKRDDARTDFLETFIWPAIGPISGVYGSQRYFNGKPRRPHFGLDIAAPKGTPVKAPASGIITVAHADMYYSGGTIMLDHGHGLSSSFLHLDTVTVKVGQVVRQGDIIATIGDSGRVTGPHLDWRMNLFKLRIDPRQLVGDMPASDQ